MAENSQQIRSFIAIELPDEVKVSLAGLQAEFKLAGHSFVKWVATEGIHITLKFLGNIPSGKVSEIVRAMERAAQGFLPFRLEVHGLGAFPNLKQPKVLWVGVGGQVDQLVSLQQRIDQALVPLGFSPESRPFAPHLTLARLREGALPPERRSFGELVQKTTFEAKLKVEVSSISLMRSQLLPTGAVYSRLAEVKLA